MRTGKSLEGEIIVFEFGADYTLGTSALALFQVEERSLIELWNPCDHTIMPGLGEYVFDVEIVTILLTLDHIHYIFLKHILYEARAT